MSWKSSVMVWPRCSGKWHLYSLFCKTWSEADWIRFYVRWFRSWVTSTSIIWERLQKIRCSLLQMWSLAALTSHRWGWKVFPMWFAACLHWPRWHWWWTMNSQSASMINGVELIWSHDLFCVVKVVAYCFGTLLGLLDLYTVKHLSQGFNCRS